jgi:tetratricopeptide (TPR) repeat protein
MGDLARSEGDWGEAQPRLEEGLALFRAIGDQRGVAAALLVLAPVYSGGGDPARARATCEEGLRVARAVGDAGAIGRSLRHLGRFARHDGDFDRARAFFEEALTQLRQAGDQFQEAFAHLDLGRVARVRGDLPQARASVRVAQMMLQPLGGKVPAAYCLLDLAWLASLERNTPRARELLAQSISVLRHAKNRFILEDALAVAGLVAMRSGHYVRGVRLHAVGETGQAMWGGELPPVPFSMRDDLQAEWDGLVGTARGVLGEEGFNRTWSEGRAMMLEQALDYALKEDGA